MKKTKYLLSLVLVLSLCLNFTSVTKAGLPTFDYANWFQNMIHYGQEVNSMIEQLNYLNNQLKIAKQNIEALNPNISIGALTELQNELMQLKNIYDYTGKITMDYKTLQNNYDSVYPNFDRWNNGLGGADYIKQMNTIQSESSIAIKNAMMAQGLMSQKQYESDSATLARLIRASQSSQGALAAAQAGNQIAAFQVQQTMRMNQVAAHSYRAETAYYGELQQKNNASNVYLENNKIKKVTPPKKGPKLPWD